MRNFKRLWVPVLTLAAACLLPLAVYAKTINLLESPQDNAKVTGTVDLASGIIPVFTPKEGDWIKVANPVNGDVGWIKKTDLKDSKGNIISVQQQVSEDKSGGKTQSVQMSYGNPASMTPEQKKKMEQTMMMQQQNVQQSMQLIQQNMDQMKKIYETQIQILQNLGFPMVPGMGTQGSNPPNAMKQQQKMN
jgi:hypothetical protein